MLPVVWEDLSGGYLLECMPLHRARRAANVGGRPGVVQVDRVVIVRLSRYLVMRLQRRCTRALGR